MTEPTERALEKVIKVGAAFSEVSSQFSHIEIIDTLPHLVEWDCEGRLQCCPSHV
jgi:hypothetical protein